MICAYVNMEVCLRCGGCCHFHMGLFFITCKLEFEAKGSYLPMLVWSMLYCVLAELVYTPGIDIRYVYTRESTKHCDCWANCLMALRESGSHTC